MFAARHQNSLFSAKARRYCDLYMESVESLLNYSPQHRFYPYEIINSPHLSAQESSDMFWKSDTLQQMIHKGVEETLAVDDEEIMEDIMEDEIDAG